MSSTATEARHLALPTDEELDAAQEALLEAIDALGRIWLQLNWFYALQEEMPGRGLEFTGSLPVETFDVPTLERIGALFIFARDVRRNIDELAAYHEGIKNQDGSEFQPSFSELVEWLDLVRKVGSGRVVRRTESDDA